MSNIYDDVIGVGVVTDIFSVYDGHRNVINGRSFYYYNMDDSDIMYKLKPNDKIYVISTFINSITIDNILNILLYNGLIL